MSARYRPGRLICLSGVDGVGKTTHAKLLVQTLRAAGRPSRYVWLRYTHYVSLAVLAVARLLGLTRYQTINGVRYGSWEFHRNRVIAAVFPWTVLIDMAAKSAGSLYWRLWRGEWVVADRFVPDILVDLMVATARRDLHRHLVGRLFRGLIPAGARIVILDVAEDDLRARRPDLVHEPSLRVRRQLYLDLAAADGLPVLRVDGGIEQVEAQLQQLVLEG